MIRLAAHSRANATLAFGALLAVAVTIGVGEMLDTKVYYPHVVLEPLENVKLEFLQEGLSNGEECHAAAARIVHAVHLNCPDCRVAVQQCPDRLEPHSERLLSEEPVAIPSSRLPHGVVAYLSDDKGLALAACNETERLTGARDGFRAICYGPNTPRPMRDSSRQQLASIGFLSPSAMAALGLVAIGGFLLLGSTVAHGSGEGSFPSRMRAGLHQLQSRLGSRRHMRRARNRLLKRLLDLAIATPLLLLLAPVFLCGIVLLWLTEGRPIFYISTRYVGLNRPVRVIKFRTMVRDACSAKYRLNERFMRDGYLDIPLTCEVYTPVGRILERLQIVELPQLLNVLVDGMSIVGNRPLPKENLDLLARTNSGWVKRFESPAGITGISQIVGKLNLGPAERLRLEAFYSRVYQEGNIIKCDLLILWYTTACVLCRNEGISLLRAEALLEGCLPHQ
jgi:lipopolysaccharide/colanic/teichoic acid biosynthesis glycosyltransferase